MAAETMPARRRDPVIQFSVFTSNRLGRLRDLIDLFSSGSVHVLGITVLDTTDSAIIRLVVDDPDKARDLLLTNEFPCTETELLVVQLDLIRGLNQMMSALLEAELNVNYLYSFIPQPQGKSIVGLSMEDNEVAEQALIRHGFQVLRQSDLSR